MKKKIIIIFFVLTFSLSLFSYYSISEKERKRINDKFDKYGLRYKKDFTVDKSLEFLKTPKGLDIIKDFTVAKTPPTVEFIVFPDRDPEYLLNDRFNQEKYFHWANWAPVVRSKDNRFYMALSDHRGIGTQINIYEYIPSRSLLHKIVDVDKLLGWTDESYTDGKIHGEMGIMPDGTLWATTHYGVYPTEEWFKNGYRGSWLLSYNIYTFQKKNWGVPLVGNMLPETKLDSKRGILFGTGANHTILAFDVINKKVRYAGYPPNGWIWWQRASLLDEKTGKFWSVDVSDKENHFLSFDPEFNKFEKLKIKVPQNHFLSKNERLRSYTRKRMMDGAFYCISLNGALFKFSPEKKRVEYIGVNWDKGRDSAVLVADSTGRYIYYMPGSKKWAVNNSNAPIVQYDVKTGKKKVIAWLGDFYYKKYGYWIGGTYGLNITKDDSTLVIAINGAFRKRTEDLKKDSAYGTPTLFVVHIPKEER